MSDLLNLPRVIFAVSLVTLWLAEMIGRSLRKQRRIIGEDEREDFNLVAAGTLTLLGLIIGFSFSMAISRYDQRKNYEEAEANAIGTEYVRVDLLPGADAVKLRGQLRGFLEQRVLFYRTRDDQELRQITAATTQLENSLWSAVQAPAMAQPTPLAALAVSGMNDVLNSEGRTQGAWWNRIPTAAWGLMATIAICSNLLIGYGLRQSEKKALLFLVLPLVVSISFFLIADIDSPRRGIIQVRPENLEKLLQTLHPH